MRQTTVVMLLFVQLCLIGQDPYRDGMGQYLCEYVAQELIEFTPGSYISHEYSTPPITKTSCLVVQMAYTANLNRVADIINQRVLSSYSDIVVTSPWSRDGYDYYMKMGIHEYKVYVVVAYYTQSQEIMVAYFDR
jgi:hypothetical protein